MFSVVETRDAKLFGFRRKSDLLTTEFAKLKSEDQKLCSDNKERFKRYRSASNTQATGVALKRLGFKMSRMVTQGSSLDETITMTTSVNSTSSSFELWEKNEKSDEDLDTSSPILTERLAGETEEDAEIRLAALSARDRTRKSTVVQIPSASIQMDLHTLYMDNISTTKPTRKNGTDRKPTMLRGGHIFSVDEEEKKLGNTFALLKQKFKREFTTYTESVEDFNNLLAYIRSNLTETSDQPLSIYKGSHWSTLVRNGEVNNNDQHSDHGRLEALWELFHAEISYLIDHLLVMRDVFARHLDHVKSFGFLANVQEPTLFANLDALVRVTSEFAKRLIRIFTNCNSLISKSTEVIVTAFKEFDMLLTPQYKKYCLNYQRAKNHLKILKEDEMFKIFMKWCEEDVRCNRRHLEDFLVAPLQHLTKYPLLLKAIRKRTPNDRHSQLLTATIISIEKSIKSIEKKFTSVVNMQRIQEIQESLSWPMMVDADPKSVLPDFVKETLYNSHCSTILTNPNRTLVLEGNLILADHNKTELYAFLFDDMLMLTKCRKKTTKRRNTTEEHDMSRKKSVVEANQSQYAVYKQPIPLDRLKLHDCDDSMNSSGLKNAFCVLFYNRYHQPVSAYTLQVSNIDEKRKWVKNIDMYVDKATSQSSNICHSSDEEYML